MDEAGAVARSEDVDFGRRQKTARGARTPVVVVTGFLGSGKTTLIRNFLASPEGQGTAIIVNEFGEIGIDHALLRSGSEATVLLGNGCLCCTVRSDLEVTMRELMADALTGRIPSFRRIVIETSGLADPGPILQTVAADRGMAREFHIDAMVTLVDAVNGASAIADASEARRQIALADRLVLTKTDLAADTAPLLESLRALNPHARILTARHGVVDPDVWTTAEIPHGRPIEEGHTHAHHSADIKSFVLRFDKPVNWRRMATALDALMQFRGADLLRIKGILAIEECEGPVIVQAVQHVLHPPTELEAWPDDDTEGRLVFITRGLGRDQVAGVLNGILAL